MEVNNIDGSLLKKMILQGANRLNENKSVVDALNVFPVPDGDTGTNMSLTMNAAAKEVDGLDKEDIFTIAQGMANGSLMGARGNSGVILSQLFRGFAKECKNKGSLSIVDVAQCLKTATDTAYTAVMKPIEGTILTVAKGVSERAMELSKRERDLNKFFKAVIEYGENILNQTPKMLKALEEAGVVDAGGKGYLTILEGFYEALSGEEVAFKLGENEKPSSQVSLADEDITFGYCTEVMIKGEKIPIHQLKEELSPMGDCMLVVGDKELVKIHIHTNHPGNVIERSLKVGELIHVKVDNMRKQHENKMFDQEQMPKNLAEEERNKEESLREYGMIAVAMGEGIENIYKDLNVDEVILGGQTMNPSTQDIKNAIDRVDAKHVFIFPNNSNIVLSANQAAKISEKDVLVIPSKTIPQGIAAILAYDESVDAESNVNNMNQALKEVKTGQVTYSVRDTKIKDLSIQKGDMLGIENGEIKVVTKTIEESAYELLKNMMDEDTEMLSIFYGQDQKKEDAENLAKKITEQYEDIEVEVYNGGQPIYYYIFSVE